MQRINYTKLRPVTNNPDSNTENKSIDKSRGILQQLR